ncbi:Branched-chain amino acid aminotransferase [Rhodovastum atsumiense]|uniref:Probable branched-chain-amino-acid aminotransferase n=1 Tax=Rhodovastum atsumiense TaxID=504468 RepID=A0A5M6IM95_9PROT|nr:branched-chain amino acid aminotransferase [Rhodovastum atsumiense]KAA5609376.1 branched-chain amino acid aminotransferase [Rhodovastum atsumiense]CAH2598590.1 Branched-chain amino acid aminotransferase [Rhodovastum atsumiense]
MRATFWLDGAWTETPPRLLGPQDHAFWLASVTFDGARAFQGCAPDLDLHCRRAVASATNLGLHPAIAAEEIERLAIEGIRRFGPEAELYIKPVFYAAGEGHFVGAAETRFVLHIFEAPLPGPAGFSATLSPLRRPAPEMAPTNAKAACLYPNSDRATREANDRGFEAAVMLDPWDNVAEFAFANLMIAKDGRVLTPAANGTFLAGITRRRVLALLNEAGIPAEEAKLTVADLQDADEIFSTGNYGKVVPCSRFEQRALNAGPIGAKARQLYFDWARTTRVI